MAINSNNGSYISTGLTNVPITNSAKTVSIWVNNSDFTSAIRSWINIVYSSSAAVQLGCRADGNLWVWDFNGVQICLATAPTTNTWFHHLYTFDGNKTHNMYLNGTLVSTNTNYTFSSATLTNIELGGNQWNEFLSGYYEDTRIYNRVLSLNEITTIYNTRGADGIVYGLVSQWLCNDGVIGSAVSTLTDISQSKNNGSVTTGTPLWYNSYLKKRKFL